MVSGSRSEEDAVTVEASPAGPFGWFPSVGRGLVNGGVVGVGLFC